MTIIALVPRVLSVNFDETLGRGLRVNMAAFRRAYEIIQQTIESLDNLAITSFETDGISLRLGYLTRTLTNLDSNCTPTDDIKRRIKMCQ